MLFLKDVARKSPRAMTFENLAKYDVFRFYKQNPVVSNSKVLDLNQTNLIYVREAARLIA